jgi:hypothetical protein
MAGQFRKKPRLDQRASYYQTDQKQKVVEVNSGGLEKEFPKED